MKNEFNALETESCFADKHFFKGKGAGAFPTAAAVLSDIAALRYDYRYEYKKLNSSRALKCTTGFLLNVSVSADVLSKIDLASFSHISRLHREAGSVRVTGVITAATLFKNDWWRKGNVSLLLSENALAENTKKKQPGFTAVIADEVLI